MFFVVLVYHYDIVYFSNYYIYIAGLYYNACICFRLSYLTDFCNYLVLCGVRKVCAYIHLLSVAHSMSYSYNSSLGTVHEFGVFGGSCDRNMDRKSCTISAAAMAVISAGECRGQ